MSESGAHRILIVDDNEDICTSLGLALRREGYVVSSAPNGHVAMKVFPEFRPDLVILDIMMPILDGWGTLNALNSMATKPIPFLIITATALRIHEEELRGIPHSMMLKPLDFDEVVHRIRQLLESVE
ncbi:response regulator [Candidatus Sumerlaeota bacterium]|nr:response regulator [Candidatus Sumerlaeota bacterium]